MHTTDAAEAEKTREAPMLWLPPANVKRDLDEKIDAAEASVRESPGCLVLGGQGAVPDVMWSIIDDA